MAAQVQITALYAALNALILMGLAILVVRQRAKTGILLGEGPTDGPLHRAIRAHANAVEYTPIVLILLLVLDLAGANAILLHCVGGGLFAGRLLHAAGLSSNPGMSKGRSIGMVLTWGALVAGAIGALYFVVTSA